MFVSLFCLFAALVAICQTAPVGDSFSSADGSLYPRQSRRGALAQRQSSITGPVIASDFPDPAIILHDGTYHAFSTSSGGMHVPTRKSAVDQNWAVNNIDALPALGAWSTGEDIWAPDVVELVSNRERGTSTLIEPN